MGHLFLAFVMMTGLVCRSLVEKFVPVQILVDVAVIDAEITEVSASV